MIKKNKNKGCIIIIAIFLVLAIIGSLLPEVTENTSLIIEKSKKNIEERNYKNAIVDLKKIKEEDSLYLLAVQLIRRADSLQNLAQEEQRKAIAQENLDQLKKEIEREITSIKEGIDFSDYRASVEKLQFELVLFASWAKIIRDGETSQDETVQKLTKELKTKVTKIQLTEFPILRKKYGEIINAKMWENDIEVSSSGRRKNYINFTGGVFAANKNKKVFQREVQEVLKMFRFKQSRYRWYKGASEYTYYTIFEGKDSDLVFF